MRGRTVLYVLLALTVPTGAFALTGGGNEAPAPSPSLSVGASLDSCGIGADTVVCKIDASWNQLPGATRYTASVARADGSVIDYGDVGAGSASFWVPYVGNGTYTVTVSAYGTPPGADEPEVIAKDSSSAGGNRNAERTVGASGGAATAGSEPADTGQATGAGQDPGTEPEPSCDEEPAEPDPDDPPADEPPDQPSQPADQPSDQPSRPASEAAASTVDDEAELPDSVDCPGE